MRWLTTGNSETTLLWHRGSGRPLHRAIVWQDRRTEPLCAQLRDETRHPGLAAAVRERTGLVIDPYFSATKIRWLLDHVHGAHTDAARGDLAFGTMDSWLLWKLTQGQVHATDVSNAARTMLFDIRYGVWDSELLAALHVPGSLLPSVHASAHAFGETTAFGAPIPVCGIAGDQQAALFGQAGFGPGVAKNTYGTGCFMLLHTGARMQPSAHGLIVTAAAQPGDAPVGAPGAAANASASASASSPAYAPAYALEGSVFVGGAVVQWLRDGLHAIRSSHEIQALAESVPDSGGVVCVPAFTGLGAPYWNADARGALLGLTRGTTLGHIARAALESIACQSAALLTAMAADATAAGVAAPAVLRVDGGASVNDLLMQHQADLLGIPVLRPAVTETTALGAAWLAGLGAGLYPGGLDELAGLWRVERRFEPQWPRERAAEVMARWEHAVRQVTAA